MHQKLISFLALFALVLTSSCTLKPDNKIEKANELMRSRVASDVTVAIEAGTEKLFEPIGRFYYVCGQGVVNQPGITNHEHERFIINVSVDGENGMAFFDALHTPEGESKFQEQWNTKCK